jgi:hypothetical protein
MRGKGDTMNTQASKGGFDDVFFALQIVSLVVLMIVVVALAVMSVW